ncbi:TPA: hypothetical protein ACITN2_004343 [Salmonella enterica subsp. enterica serovar Virchow]
MAQRRVTPAEASEWDLVALQRAGKLYWRDPEPLPAWFFGDDYYRIVRLNKHRQDFTAETLARWAEGGTLYIDAL